MNITTEKAYAKINLCLNVGGRAANGYHYVQSVMQAVSLCDMLTVEKASGISLECNAPDLPCGRDNLAYRAAESFFRASGIAGGAHISLEKHIPVCAGMGGGSADAAAVLRAINRLYGAPLDTVALLSTAATLGADVPFCVRCGTAYADGFGERIAPLPDLRLYYVLVPSDVKLSTPQMYAELDRATPPHIDTERLVAAINDGNAATAAACAGNSFLPTAKLKCPDVEENIRLLLRHGAASACITGKGPTVFGAFADRQAALSCAEALPGTIFCESVSPIEYMA